MCSPLGRKIAAAAEIDALAVAYIHERVRLRGHRRELRLTSSKAHDVAIAEAIAIASREVSVNAVANLDSGAHDLNGLADEHASVVAHVDVAVILDDAFALRSGAGRKKCRREQTEQRAMAAKSAMHIASERKRNWGYGSA